MKYEIDGDDLCIRVSIDAIAQNAADFGGVSVIVRDKRALALAVGKELCDCEDSYTEEFYINKPLDDALVRVIECADPSLIFEE